jgi:hypothetical protein
VEWVTPAFTQFVSEARQNSSTRSDTVKKRAGIDDLTFHDLRHEAGSRFDAMGLTKGEQDMMMGHANSDIETPGKHPGQSEAHIRSGPSPVPSLLGVPGQGGCDFKRTSEAPTRCYGHPALSGRPRPCELATK